MTAVPVMTAGQLLDRLRRHYLPPQPLPGGIFVPEVGINGQVGQRCDAVYVGFTSASGRVLVGHEVKVSRADWLHELDRRDKADKWADACQEWWIVAPSVEVVRPEEIPHGWGLMVVNPRSTTRLDKKVRPETRRHDPPWWAVRSVLARYDTLRAGTIANIDAAAYDKAYQRARADLAKEAERAIYGREAQVRAVLAAYERLHPNGTYIPAPDPELVATALLDYQTVRSAAQTLAHTAVQVADQVRRDAEHMMESAARMKGLRQVGQQLLDTPPPAATIRTLTPVPEPDPLEGHDA